MIIVRITGGLGNQMFQYAFGRSIAARKNEELILDISSYSSNYHTNAPRKFLLDNFNCHYRIAIPKDFRSMDIPDMGSNSLIAKIERYLLRRHELNIPLEKRKYITEPSFAFSKDIYEAASSCFLSGVWQSEKYFIDIRDVLLKEFTLRFSLSKKASECLKTIKSADISISLHVRRGDYAHNPKVRKKHGLTSVDFYERALNLLRKSMTNFEIFVFSDDIEWAKSNLNIPFKTHFISDPDIHDFEELHLMSSCDHNIIANSTFSWWAAWLNENNKKKVIAPADWFSNNPGAKDIYPSEWMVI